MTIRVYENIKVMDFIVNIKLIHKGYKRSFIKVFFMVLVFFRSFTNMNISIYRTYNFDKIVKRFWYLSGSK